MSPKPSTPDVKVEDVMSTPVITIKDTDTVLAAAKLMRKHKIGCVVVIDKSGKTRGLMTERDIVRRVTAQNVLPGKVKAGKAMTHSPVTVSPSTSITEAAKVMRAANVRRLIVMEEGKLRGIVTSNDIVDVTPSLIDVVAEKSQVGRVEPPPKAAETGFEGGYCDKCGAWAEELKPYEGQFVCADCLVDLTGAEAEEEES